MKKILGIIFGILLVGTILAFLSKNWLLEAAIEQAVTRITGFKTEVGGLRYDFPATIHIKELKVHNPSGFKEDVFAYLPEIYASLDLQPLLKKEKVHLHEIRLNIAQVHLEKNIEGVSNIQLLSSVGKVQGKEQKPKPAGKQMPFQLDRLVLTIHEVSYEDASGLAPKIPGQSTFGKLIPTDKIPVNMNMNVSGLPKKASVDLGVEQEVFYNITDPKALVNLIVVKIVYGTTFGKVLGVNPDALMKDTLKNTMGKTSEQFSGLFGKLKSVVETGENAADSGQTAPPPAPAGSQ
ncbi:MAG: AsmA family protein [Candidatus Omnitrophica bacterium]|nr:AsmA family protein [Candidatus Omnitrophota bacterium]